MNGPKLWADMLAAINIPGAVVAGGCIRDCFLSVEHKDIDICIPARSCNDMMQCVDGLRERGLFHGDMMDREEYEADEIEEGSLFGVASGELMGHKVDLIARRIHQEGPMALIQSFDFGIVQVFYDGESCKFTDAQRIDSMVRRATMMHDRHVEQSLARFFRFNQRNPGLLALAVPFEYDHGHSGRRDDDLVAF
ncbi:tRNA nucleotidyltransferase [Sphingomonas phage Scott]|uniref:tRNA nucleotidyltransferase n=1 Tax=Sphingomonas phage Scott TaxID=2282912 RepID=A0A346FD98_9CAUD|nr:nucleotidyltransferase [Sphingomonas phage Scott]AXN53712.1 tRNA nucleotidyltransferase [Sphingomonas phage Scott]